VPSWRLACGWAWRYWALGSIEPGAVMLDLGSLRHRPAGRRADDGRRRTGDRRRRDAGDVRSGSLEYMEDGTARVEPHGGLIEALPIDDASVDVVISNGVIELVPDKKAAFDRVLRPGGRLQVADVIIHTAVSEDARQRIDMWTG
jgi:ubiquinone/menaquinone biosynthesis C-methylase UbiE